MHAISQQVPSLAPNHVQAGRYPWSVGFRAHARRSGTDTAALSRSTLISVSKQEWPGASCVLQHKASHCNEQQTFCCPSLKSSRLHNTPQHDNNHSSRPFQE